MLKNFSPNAPVIICGVDESGITQTGLGVMEFENLAAALEVFPELNPAKGSKNFTWAMGGSHQGASRFETRKANDLYST